MGVFSNVSMTEQPTTPTADDQTINDPTYGRKVFVGNLSFRTNFKSLKAGFAKVGTVERVSVVSKDGKRLGFGYVQFADEASAQKAIETMNNTELDERTIKVELARPSTRRIKKRPKTKKNSPASKPAEGSKDSEGSSDAKPARKQGKRKRRVRIPIEDREISENVIYIRGISDDVSDEDLKELFKDFGVEKITLRRTIRWIKGERLRIRQGFIVVDSAEHQQAAVDALDGKEVSGETLYVRKAFKQIPRETIEAAQSTEENTEASKPKKKRPRKKSKSNTAEKSDDKAAPAEGEASPAEAQSSDSETKTKKTRPRKSKPRATKKKSETASPEATENKTQDKPSESTE